MSGIILPGQPKKPQSSGGGFEIASGFVKKKDPKPAEQPTEQAEKIDEAPITQPETPATSTAAAPTAAAPCCRATPTTGTTQRPGFYVPAAASPGAMSTVWNPLQCAYF